MFANINETPNFITLHSYPQAITHIDCDAFFASCEQARNPKLKGSPLATGEERGIVSCPSYEAKSAGVVRGMRLQEARKACPKLITLPSDYELYSIYSERLFSIIRKFTPDVEEYSIDEAFCDLTGLRRIYCCSYPEIAFRIKQDIQKALGITVSVGLSLSKTLAKICSKQNKPDGFLAMPGNQLHKFFPNIALERVCGFGPNTVSLLEKCGVKNVLDYVQKPKAFTEKLLGKVGVELWLELRGEYVYKVSTEQKRKYLTISKTKTFMPPSKNRDFIKGQLIRNLESACIKLRRHNLSTRNLTVYLRKSDFTGLAMEGRINRHSSSTLDFTNVCAELFERIFEEHCSYRATGVVLSDIVPEGRDSSDLFEDPVKIERIHKISTVIDEINSAYGKHTLHVASSHIVNQKESHPRNCIAWRKQELLKGETFRKRIGIPLLNLK